MVAPKARATRVRSTYAAAAASDADRGHLDQSKKRATSRFPMRRRSAAAGR